jgi:hypothetical protein
MQANALLIRYFKGWAERTDTTSIASYGRKEALLGLGAIQTQTEAYVIADQQLAVYKNIRTAIAADLQPVSTADTPYLAFGVGDTITAPDYDGSAVANRVMSITVTEDEDGNVTYAPEIKDVVLGAQERFAQNVKKMADGTIRGDSKAATPVSVSGAAGPTCCAQSAPGGG